MKPRSLLVTAVIGFAAATHLNAVVTVTKQPADQVVSFGAHVTNVVTATSTAPPLSYQWWGKGAVLTDQTNRTLVFQTIQVAQAGEYYVVVSDADNQPLQSNPATITVDQTFIKLTEGPLVTDVEPTEGSTWWDYDNDGDLDVIVHVAAIHGPGVIQSFYQNSGDGTFIKITTNAVAQTMKRALIGAVGDYDNDGDQDLYLNSNAWQATEPKDDLFRNDGNGLFVALAVGPWTEDLDHTFDCTFVDVDQDGLLDIFVMNYSQPPCFYRQTEAGAFTKLAPAQVGSLFRNPGLCYNAAWVDYDNDGFVDLSMTCGTADGTTTYPRLNHLYRNNGRASGNANHWLKVKLNGVASNRSGIGAKIHVKATIADKELWQVREMTGNGYSQTCPGLVAHFGLGDAATADIVRVEWPSGVVQELANVTADQILTVWEPPFLRAAMFSNGACQLTISAEPNRAWRLEASGDLKAWEPLATETHPEVTFQHTDTTAASTGQRFYRIAEP